LKKYKWFGKNLILAVYAGLLINKDYVQIGKKKKKEKIREKKKQILYF